jgi:hypothetical protein
VSFFSRVAWALALSLASSGCQDDPAPVAAAAAAGQANAAADEALRQAREAAAKELNPRGLPVYSGPVGSVRGTVKISGDEPPAVPEMLAKLPADGCPRARELHGKLYRQGPERTLGDALVTVTEYQGFLPARGDAVRVEAKGCAFDARILAMTFGQHLEVYNLDAQAYMPRLIGTPSYALRVAMPGGAPVPIFVPKPGQYMLIDQTREFIRADLFVLSYPTFAVTAPDGKFEITGIPVGTVKVTAYAPAIGKVVEQSVEVKAGLASDLALQIEFSESEYRRRLEEATQPAKK